MESEATESISSSPLDEIPGLPSASNGNFSQSLQHEGLRVLLLLVGMRFTSNLLQLVTQGDSVAEWLGRWT